MKRRYFRNDWGKQSLPFINKRLDKIELYSIVTPYERNTCCQRVFNFDLSTLTPIQKEIAINKCLTEYEDNGSREDNFPSDNTTHGSAVLQSSDVLSCEARRDKTHTRLEINDHTQNPTVGIPKKINHADEDSNLGITEETPSSKSRDVKSRLKRSPQQQPIEVSKKSEVSNGALKLQQGGPDLEVLDDSFHKPSKNLLYANGARPVIERMLQRLMSIN